MLWRPLRRLLRRGPAVAQAHRLRADALFDAGEYEAAAAAYDALLRSDPSAGARVNLGYAHLYLGHAAAARDAFRDALARSPDFAPALTGLADTCAYAGEHAAAVPYYRRALAADPDLAVAHNNLSLTLAALGELEQSWGEAEWRYELPQAREYYPRGKLGPRWYGAPLGAERLLIHWEQGYGDIIQHLRFLPLVQPRAAHFAFECPPPLLRLARAMLGAAHVIESRAEAPPFDVCAPLLSLPRLLGLDRNALPGPPYLKADAQVAARIRQEWSGKTKRLLGIVWRSGRFDSRRDIDLDALLPLAHEARRLVSLQKETNARERERLRACGAIDAGLGFADFFDTACAIAALDAVVCVDTAVAHLAGALGCPTVLLLGEPPAARWMIDRADSPWYPSLRLLPRALRLGNDELLAQIEAALGSGQA